MQKSYEVKAKAFAKLTVSIEEARHVGEEVTVDVTFEAVMRESGVVHQWSETFRFKPCHSQAENLVCPPAGSSEKIRWPATLRRAERWCRQDLTKDYDEQLSTYAMDAMSRLCRS